MKRAWVARTKPIKYAFKQRALAASPWLYWTVRWLLRGYPEPELALLQHLCRPDAVSVDIGANWGFYTYFALRHSLACHVFEPQPRLAETLRNGYRGRPVSVHQVALSDQEGTARLRVPRTDIGYATIEPTNRLTGKVDLGSGLEQLNVDMRRLDDYDLPEVGFVKVDVEGHEIEVLMGATGVIERSHPSFIVEVEERHRAGSIASVHELMARHGYEVWCMRRGRMVPYREPGDGQRCPSRTDPHDPVRNFVFLQPEVARVVDARLGG